MFNETAGEHVMVFAKFEPFLAELREKFQSPEAFKHLETMIMGLPNGAEKVKKTQEWLKTIGETMSQAKAEEASA